MTTITLAESRIVKAAAEGMDSFINTIVQAFREQAGDTLNAESMARLNADQVTLWGYTLLRDELMDGGFVQLIYNGYGPFFFDNPFAKAMRLWGLRDFSKLLYKAKAVYDERKADLTRERSDEEFMALFEQYPEFDDLDDAFVEDEEQITAALAYYVDEHIADFVTVTKD